MPESKDASKSPPLLPEDFIREAKARGIPIPDAIPTEPPDNDDDDGESGIQQTMGGTVDLGDN